MAGLKGYEEPQGLSNTFATWFRWIAIAMIADVLWPGRRGLALPPHDRHRLQGCGLARTAMTRATSRIRSITCMTRIMRGLCRARGDVRHARDARRRMVESLDGEWLMSLDLFDEGLRQRWFALDETPPSQWATRATTRSRLARPCLCRPAGTCSSPNGPISRAAPVHALDRLAAGCCGRTGADLVRRANYAALVFLNGQHIGGHRGGSTPFSLEATGALQPGRNRLQSMSRTAAGPIACRCTISTGSTMAASTVRSRLSVAGSLRSKRLRGAAAGPEVHQVAMTLSDPADAEGRIEIPGLGVAGRRCRFRAAGARP